MSESTKSRTSETQMMSTCRITNLRKTSDTIGIVTGFVLICEEKKKKKFIHTLRYNCKLFCLFIIYLLFCKLF